jgi:hypothetical protein
MKKNVLNAPWMTKNWNRQERLAALASFLPLFSDPDFKFGEWQGGQDQNGVLTMPWFSMSPEALRFHEVLYDYGYVREFDWNEWARTEEGIALRDDPQAIENADEDQLARLLTALARADRFSDGVLHDAYDSGLLARIVARAAVLIHA